MKVLPDMSILSKISTDTDAHSARLAGIALMLVSVCMFAFGDALGKFIVATYSVGQLLLLRATAALIVLSPAIWRHRRRIFSAWSGPWLQLLRVVLSTLEVAAFFLATVYLPLADVITYYLACPIFVTALSAIGAPRAGRLAALERRRDRVLRCADRAAAVSPDRDMAGDDRARRLYGVRGADADHAFAAGDVRYRAGLSRSSCRHLHAFGAVLAPFGWIAPGLGGLSLCYPRPAASRVCALLCGNRSLKLAPASLVVPYQYSMIVWAVMFGYLVFGDVPSPATIVGAVIIIGAGFYIFLRERELGRGEKGGQSAGVELQSRNPYTVIVPASEPRPITTDVDFAKAEATSSLLRQMTGIMASASRLGTTPCC